MDENPDEENTTATTIVENINATVAAATIENKTEEVLPAALETDASEIPVKFTLLGVVDVTDVTDFKETMLTEFKSALASISKNLGESVKFTSVEPRFMGIVHESGADNYQFYYDVGVALTEDANANAGELLIGAVQEYHSGILEQMQTYKSSDYYYVEDFELCTPSELEANENVNESVFDLCNYDHELISTVIGVVGLSNIQDIDDFNKEMVQVLKDIIGNTQGLTLAGVCKSNCTEDMKLPLVPFIPVYLTSVSFFFQDAVDNKREGQAIDFYYTIDILDKENLSPKSAVLARLEGNDAMSQIYNHIESYTGQELCMTDEGRYSTEPCTRSLGRLSTWQIILISIATIVVFGFLALGIYKILRCRRKPEVNEQAYARRYSRDRKKKKPHKSHRHSRHSHRHSDQNQKRSHHHREKRRHHNSDRHHRSRHRSEYSDDSYDRE
eukprot:scaffold236806_cov119-Cyclotella_meneghiniana.AAC.6